MAAVETQMRSRSQTHNARQVISVGKSSGDSSNDDDHQVGNDNRQLVKEQWSRRIQAFGLDRITFE